MDSPGIFRISFLHTVSTMRYLSHCIPRTKNTQYNHPRKDAADQVVADGKRDVQWVERPVQNQPGSVVHSVVHNDEGSVPLLMELNNSISDKTDCFFYRCVHEVVEAMNLCEAMHCQGVLTSP